MTTSTANSKSPSRIMFSIALIWAISVIVLLAVEMWFMSFEPPVSPALRLTIAALIAPVVALFGIVAAFNRAETRANRILGLLIAPTCLFMTWVFYHFGIPIDRASINGGFAPFVVMRIWDIASKKIQKNREVSAGV